MFYQFNAKATIALHTMEEIGAQSFPKTTQITKRAMIHTPEKLSELGVSPKYCKRATLINIVVLGNAMQLIKPMQPITHYTQNQ